MTGRSASRETMESYVVRVYRRSRVPGHEVAGLVEHVERGTASAFTGRDELWAALSAPVTARDSSGTRNAAAAPRIRK